MKNAAPALVPGPLTPRDPYAGLPLREALFCGQLAYGLFAVDATGNITDWSPAAERIYGYTREEVLGRSPALFHRPEDRAALGGEIRSALDSQGYWAGEINIVRKDGTAGVTEAVVFSYQDDQGQSARISVVRDISASKQVEAALRDNSEKLRLITDNVPVFILHLDAEQRYRFVNQTAVSIIGKPREHIIGKRVVEVMDLGLYSQVEPFIVRALQGEEVTFECERLTPDGCKILQATHLPERNEHGQVIGCFVVAVDVTGRKHIETATLESEARLRMITDNMPAIVGYIDADQRFEFVNKGIEDLYGLPRAAMLGKRVPEVMAEDWYRELAPRIERALAGEEVVFTQRRIAHDGIPHDYQSIYLPHFDEQGHVVGCYALSMDVTARTQAEAELAEQEQLLHLITDNVAAMIAYVDSDRRYRFANKAFEELHGLPSNELVGKRVEAVVGRQAYREIGPHIEAGLAGEAATFEQVRTLADGRKRTYDTRYIPHIDNDGTVCGVYALLVDITERVEAERELRESEQTLRLVTDNLPGHFVYFDADLRYRFVNKGVEELFGKPREEIIGRHSRELQGEAMYNMVVDQLKRVLAGETVTFEQRRTTACGAVRDYETTYLPHVDDDGRIAGCYVMSVDITERKRAEEELRRNTQAAELLRKIAVAANHADTPAEAIQVSLDELCAYSGWPVGHAYLLADSGSNELVSANLWHLDEVERYARFRQTTESTVFRHGHGLPGSVLATAAPRWVVDVAPGPEFPRASVGASVGIRSGFAIPVLVGRQVAAVLEFFTGEKVEHDDDLLAIAEQVGVLIGRVIERQRTQQNLRAAKEEAELASRSKSEFLANMSHELRTPLNAIIGFSEIINEELLSKADNGAYRQYAKHIRDSGRHLLTLINDILDISKIETGNVELREERVEIVGIIESAIAVMQERAEARGVRVNVELPEGPLPALNADGRRLKQVLVNLLSNGVKFSACGGCVTVKAWQNADGFVLQVADTGIGMEMSDIPKALGRFQQVESDLNRKYEGAGLGLPLAKALVEQHGGSLDLQSKVGVGTTVTVRLPAERIILLSA